MHLPIGFEEGHNTGPRSPGRPVAVAVAAHGPQATRAGGHGSHGAGPGDFVVVEHSGRNAMPDGRRYDNNYCWVFRFQDDVIQEVREYMDTQLVTETFGAEGNS